MKYDCPGLRHEWEGAGIYCPKRAPEEPEDGDWDAFCTACLAARDDYLDRLADWAVEDRYLARSCP